MTDTLPDTKTLTATSAIGIDRHDREQDTLGYLRTSTRWFEGTYTLIYTYAVTVMPWPKELDG